MPRAAGLTRIAWAGAPPTPQLAMQAGWLLKLPVQETEGKRSATQVQGQDPEFKPKLQLGQEWQWNRRFFALEEDVLGPVLMYFKSPLSPPQARAAALGSESS